MRIGLIGYGGVGKASIKSITEESPALKARSINLKAIYIMGSKKGLYNPQGTDCVQLSAASKDGQSITIGDTDRSREIIPEFMLQNKDIDLLVELANTNKETGEPVRSYILKALQSKVHVATGNKGPIVYSYRELARAAKENGVHLEIGCIYNGVFPSVNGGTIEMAGLEVYSIEGVLDGTTNYILKGMEDIGCTYGATLEGAKAYGIAEADPSFDVDGWDTVFKLLILTNMVMKQDKKLFNIQIGGIIDLTPENIQATRAEGKRYKLIGRTIREGEALQMVVRSGKLGTEHLLYHVNGKNKTVRYESDTLGELTLIGGASGTTAAAASILGDIISIYGWQPIIGEWTQESATFRWTEAMEKASRYA